MPPNKLVDLLDEWCKEGRGAAPLAFIPPQLSRYLADERVTALQVVAGHSALQELGLSEDRSWQDLLGLVSSGGVNEVAEHYEQKYGGIGPGHDGYRRGYEMLHILSRLANRLSRLGEQETAIKLSMLAMGLVNLPSWQRAFEFEIRSAIEKASSADEPEESDFSNPGFVLLYPVAKGLALLPNEEALADWLNSYLEKHWDAYSWEFRQQLASFKQVASRNENGGMFGPRDILSPEQFFDMEEPIVRHACRREAAFFLAAFMQAKSYDIPQVGPDEGSVIGLLLRQCQGYDPLFIEALDEVMHDRRLSFYEDMSPEGRVGWWQLLDAVKLVEALVEEGAAPEQIRERLLADFAGLQYVHSSFQIIPLGLANPLQLIYMLATCTKAQALENLILHHAEQFNNDFLLALHSEQNSVEAIMDAGDAIGDRVPGDKGRLQRLGEIIGNNISGDGLGPVRIDREQLHRECVAETLLHTALSGWSAYRKAQSLCACLPDMDEGVCQVLISQIRLNCSDEHMEAIRASLQLCEQVIGRRSTGENDDDLGDSLVVRIAVAETVDEYQFLGMARNGGELCRLWLMGISQLADGERRYADELGVGLSAQQGGLGKTQLAKSIWERFLKIIKTSTGDDRENLLQEFIKEHTKGPALDTENCYLRSYLHATRAALALARGEDPVKDVGSSLGYAARAGVYPFIVLFSPCWFMIVHYVVDASEGWFSYSSIVGAMAEHIASTSDEFLALFLRRFMPAFRPLEQLTLCKIDNNHHWDEDILEELGRVEESCGGVMAEWSLRDWMGHWLIRRGLRSS